MPAAQACCCTPALHAYSAYSQVILQSRAHPGSKGLAVAGDVADGPGSRLLLGCISSLQLALQRRQRALAHAGRQGRRLLCCGAQGHACCAAGLSVGAAQQLSLRKQSLSEVCSAERQQQARTRTSRLMVASVATALAV